MTSPDQFSTNILATLSTTIPGLSCALGTPERKIIDACAEAMSGASVSQYLSGSALDINTMTGLQLEQFCLVPGTPVSTPTGPRVIEDLRTGDSVLTHTGKVSEVLATSARVVDEDVVTIRTAVGVEYTMTKNHPVWVTRRSSMTMLASQVGNWRRDGSKDAEHALRLRGLGNRTVWDSRDLDRDFIPAGQVGPGDIVWGPDPGSRGVQNTLSPALKRLLGWYLAEGHIHHRERSSEIGFTFHSDEVEYQDEVESLLRSEWGITHVRRQQPSANCTQLICYNTRLARWLEEFAGKGAANKHIPLGLEEEDWTPLISTYWRGDGTATKKQSLRATTVSPTLAWQLYEQMVRMGLSPRLTKENASATVIMGRSSYRRDTWRVSVEGESALVLSELIDYPLRHESVKNYASPSVRMDGFVGSPVVKVTESRHQGSVYNIEVAGDNSYELLGSFGVHNCGIFGFGRLQGIAATGTVQVTMSVPSTSNTNFALGTQFYTSSNSGAATTLYFASTQAAVLTAGNLTVSIPVQCTTVGSAGNVPPDSITYLSGSLGSATVTNLSAMTGGVDTETDQELRQRFQDTVMRNVAGTADFYKALCQQNNAVSRVAVYGPVSLYTTQLAVPATEVALSTLTEDVKYIWPNMTSVFTDLGQPDQTFYSPLYDYNFSDGAPPPTFTTIPTGALAALVGNVVDLEFQYTPTCSRNDPPNGILNKVDVFTDGMSPFSVTEQTVVSADLLTSNPTDPFYTGNFVRVGSPGNPVAGNRFMRLGSTPVVSFPSSITVNGINYVMGTHYFLLQDTTLMAGTQLETSGLEWVEAGAATGQELTLSYVYNQVPQLLNALVSSSKQITTDVLIHQGQFSYLQPCINVEYDRNYSVTTVNAAITNRLQQYFAQLPFGAQIKLSNIMMYVQQTQGVVDVAITSSTDNPNDYGVQVFSNSANLDPTTVYNTDFKLDDNQLAVYQGCLITRIATP